MIIKAEVVRHPGRDPIKLAVWVERSVRRVVLQLPVAAPWLPEQR